MKTNEKNADWTDFADKRARGGERRAWEPSGDVGKKPFKMVAWNYDSVNTRLSD